MRKICILLAAALFFSAAALSGCAAEGERSLYRIEAAYEDGELRAVLTLSYANATGQPQQVLPLLLYANAYREGAKNPPVSPSFRAAAYYAGESFGGVEISSVSPCAGWRVGGEDENVLYVELGEPVPDGGRAEIAVAYTLRLPAADHRTGVTHGGTVNLGNFYPVLCVWEDGGFRECAYAGNGDPFYSDCADYEVTFTADAACTVAASGALQRRTVAGGRATHVFSLQNARDFAIVFGPSLRTVSAESGGVRVAYCYEDDPAPQETLALLCEALGYFSHTFGGYPYEAYTAVQTGFCHGGMEYPALVMLSDALAGQGLAYTAVHETAHQWWYAAVGSDQCTAAWMDEGLAEYSAALFFEAHPAYGIERETLLHNARTAYNAFCTVWQQVFGAADTSMDRPLSAYGEYEYAAIAYAKGLLLFDTLENALGRAAFLRGLRGYFRAFCGGIAAPADLAAAWHDPAARDTVYSFVEGRAVI